MSKKGYSRPGLFGVVNHYDANGFYEWNRLKEKNTFARYDAPVLYMAGFCDWFENERRFVILTTAANESMRKFVDADAVDYKRISICHKGDIVVSQDYGVAAMALGKGAYAIHQSGKWYTNGNIDQKKQELNRF